MYLPPAFREDDLAAQHALIRSHPLGLLVTGGSGGLSASPVPMVLYPDEGELGTLRAHLARANPHWAEVDATAECLVVFQGPEAYVSPSWYATKRETGKVMPTWNYVMVQVRGEARVVEDAEWLRRQVEDLTNAHEGSRPAPWRVGDAPAPFVAAQLRGIVGIEIVIRRIEGKWKASQNRGEADRRGVVEGLRAEGAAAAEMAGVVAERGQSGGRS